MKWGPMLHRLNQQPRVHHFVCESVELLNSLQQSLYKSMFTKVVPINVHSCASPLGILCNGSLSNFLTHPLGANVCSVGMVYITCINPNRFLAHILLVWCIKEHLLSSCLQLLAIASMTSLFVYISNI